MVSKVTICCIIIISLATLVWCHTRSKSDVRKIEKKQKEMRDLNKKISRIIPRKLNAKQKKGVKKALERYTRNWDVAKSAFKKKGLKSKSMTKRKWKKLEKEFDKTKRNVEKSFAGKTRKKRGKKKRFLILLSYISFNKIKDTLKEYDIGWNKIVDVSKRMSISTYILVEWMDKSKDLSVEFYKVLAKVFDQDKDESTDDSDDDDDGKGKGKGNGKGKGHKEKDKPKDESKESKKSEESKESDESDDP